MQNSLAKLNPEQQKAATHKEGPLLIVAGAGTGKTTVLINRLAFLTKEKLAKQEEVLLVTFTRKSAEEIEERSDKLLPYGYVDRWISTFHDFCARILREHALDIGLPGDFKVVTDTEQWVLIKKNLDEFNLNYYRPIGNPTKFIHELIKHFSRLKDENISSEEYLAYASELEQNGDAMLGGKTKKTKAKVKKAMKAAVANGDYGVKGGENEVDGMEAERIIELANAYHVYNKLLLDNSFLDFGDLICYTLKLFRERPNILKYYQSKFKYIMVDEFQDTNWAQYELIKVLAGEKKNLVVVGDDDQCLPKQSLITTKTKKITIDKIKVGDEVATAVGKGYLSYSKVSKVNSNVKKTKLITFTTQGGRKITVTENHKMFCHVPTYSNKKFFYVYLMHKQNLGWRIGITNDLALRLRLERSADRILAIMSFKTEEEARYMESFLSLKYGIPTVRFKEREGVMTTKKWSERLYQDLDVEGAVGELADDLGIDLDCHQVCLNGVNRGEQLRIKINLEMCSRNYRSKYSKGCYLENPSVLHTLTVETSHQPTIEKLQRLGFKLSDSKKGKRIRLTGADLNRLGKISFELQKATGGIIENSAKIGATNVQHLKSLIIPASNILPGMYLPIVTPKGVKHEEIISRKEDMKNIKVYDLEVEKTHNFIANDVVVHNSIYKFRGASLSNIMQFKDDFPEAKEIILASNYRSGQEILDKSYHFISNNNPNRLEKKLGISKKLKAQKKEKGTVDHLHYALEQDETRGVVQKIIELKNADKETRWLDFAVLVRANDTANKFIAELKRKAIPVDFVSQKGLYSKPVILDIISYFKLLDNYHESSALFRVLNIPNFCICHSDIINLNYFIRTKAWSMFEGVQNIAAIPKMKPESIANAGKLMAMLNRHSDMARRDKPSRIFLKFINESGLIRDYDFDKDKEIFNHISQFYKRIKFYENNDPNLRLKDFMELLALEMDSGESGSLQAEADDADTVKVMTVHASKGKEFKYVFIANVVDKKFPTIGRSEKISIPDALVREKLPEGDNTHLEEERRLFYVAMTRAKDKLFLSSASDYGGAQKKKLSQFLFEAGLADEGAEPMTGASGGSKENELIRDLRDLENVNMRSLASGQRQEYYIPYKFSFSQIETYNNCPLLYKLNYILKIPIGQKAVFTYGRVMHGILRDFLFPLMAGEVSQQGLFGAHKKEIIYPDFKKLMEIFEAKWEDDGYDDKRQREQYKKKAKESLKVFYETLKNNGWPSVLYLEKSFAVRLGNYIFRGIIDRVDELPDGTVRILDYKTGAGKDALKFEEKRQLILYKIAMEDLFQKKVSELAYYYIDNGNEISFNVSDKDVEKFKEQTFTSIEGIKACNFTPKPGFNCDWCDYKGICEFKKNGGH